MKQIVRKAKIIYTGSYMPERFINQVRWEDVKQLRLYK